jgi:hypothetical protein
MIAGVYLTMNIGSSLCAAGFPLERDSAAASGIGLVDQAPGCLELSLLLTCLAADLETSRQARLTELLKKDISWDYLLDMAAWHGIMPLLAIHLVGHPAVPPSVSESLQQSALANAAKNLFLSAELTRISAVLASEGVPHIPYKGTILSQYLYGSVASRSVCDIDLIVRSEDVLKTIKCLEGLGFEDSFGLSASLRATAIRYGFEYSFVRDGISVDLHWRLVQQFCWPSLDMDRVWKSLAPFSFSGAEVPIFSPEYMLSALCVHSAQHDWMELKMFADIAQLLLRHPSLEWRMIEELTADSHSRRSMLVALCLTHTNLGAPLPPTIVRAIAKDHQVSLIADRVYSTIWPSRTSPAPVRADVKWLLFRTNGERWTERWRYISGVALGPTIADFWSIEIPPSLGWLYFAVRPLRIFSDRLRRPATHGNLVT